MHRQGQGPTGEGGGGGVGATVAGGGRHTLLGQARQWSKPLAPGGRGGFFFFFGGTAMSLPSTAASWPSWRRLALLAPGPGSPGQEAGEAPVLCSEGLVFKIAHCQPPLHTHQESLEGAQVELRGHVCVFSLVLPAQKGGPTGGKEGVCAVLGRKCVGPGVWMRPRTPTRCPAEQARREARPYPPTSRTSPPAVGIR